MAVATPCWPAPVSATSRLLPMRRASSAWPSTLLILCEPVWLRSSRLSSSRSPSCSAETVALGERRWSAGVVAQQVVELGAEGGVGPGRAEGGLELEAGRHERLGDEPAAELAEAAVGRRLGHERPGAARWLARLLGGRHLASSRRHLPAIGSWDRATLGVSPSRSRIRSGGPRPSRLGRRHPRIPGATMPVSSPAGAQVTPGRRRPPSRRPAARRRPRRTTPTRRWARAGRWTPRRRPRPPAWPR